MTRIWQLMLVSLVVFGGAGRAPADMLVAHWSFDNESNPGFDETGNGHEATVSGPTWVDGALSFDGIDDVATAFETPTELAQHFATYTVQVRFKATDFSHGTLIVRQDDPGGSHADNFQIRPDDDGSGRAEGTHEYNCCQNCYVRSPLGAALDDDRWHTVTLTYDGAVLRLYRDGCLDEELGCGPPAYAGYSPSVIRIGANYSLTNLFAGLIDDVKIYDYAVSIDPGLDCNGNGISDACDLANCDGSPWCSDSNGNGVLDGCDVAIETVTVGNPGNVGELSGSGAGGYGPDRVCGAVDYIYHIGKFEITAGQYTKFLNAVAVTDAYGLYNTDMWTREHGCKIERIGSSGDYSYSVAPEWANRPVNYVSWGDVARFCNWLHNGQPTGAQDPGTTEDGSYTLNGVMSDAELLNVVRSDDATWVIPSEDEWYKAAYHYNNGATGTYYNYPTQSDTAPTAEAPPGTDMINGSANHYSGSFVDPIHYRTEVGAYEAKPSDSPYGTFDQGGNVWEWNESLIGAARVNRGASFNTNLAGDYDSMHAAGRSGLSPTHEAYGLGFRVADVLVDCNGNSIPDICDLDCGYSGGPCDVPGCGESEDCQPNGIPDECEGIWVERFPPSGPSARLGHAVAYDAGRQVTVLFGGTTGGSETWEWDGTVWTEKTPQPPEVSPSARVWHAMTYDAHRGVVVLFGGDEDGTVGDADSLRTDDTWEWDGTAWTEATPANRPGARCGHAMAYDAERQVTVLFAGSKGPQESWGDTWEWDGTAWTERLPSLSPTARNVSSMVYDAARKVCVLFGGNATDGRKGDTWEWDGDAGTWTQRSPGGSPGEPLARETPRLAYDTARNVTVLFGGNHNLPGGPGVLDDTWEWDGNTWVQTRPLISPPARYAHAMAYDAARGVTVLFGGSCNNSATLPVNDTWEYGLPHPMPDCNNNGTPDEQDIENGTSLDCNGNDIPDECDIADGTSEDCQPNGIPDECELGWTWTLRSTEGPAPTIATAMVYDSARDRLVLFGGNTGDWNYNSETWEWDGSTWSLITTAGPSPRAHHAMAYDSVREKTVLFGGVRGPTWTFYGDTWEWDGTSWTPMSGGGPSGRSDHAMVYDAGSGKVVLFGGGVHYSVYDDTWVWDGTSWTEVSPAIRPAHRNHHAMAYDTDRGVTVLFGGNNYDDTYPAANLLNDTWEWDGSAWTEVLTGIAPSIRRSHRIAYDHRAGGTILFGGGELPRLDDTWKWDGTQWTQLTPLVSPAPRELHTLAYDSNRDVLWLFGGVDESSQWSGETWEFHSVINDCNSNGILDECDLADCDGTLWCSDCNENVVLDECDIADGTSEDCQPNGIPDDCDILPTILGDVLYAEDFEDGTMDGISVYRGSGTLGTGLTGSTTALHAGGGDVVFRIDALTSDNVSIEADFVVNNSGTGDFHVWVNSVLGPPSQHIPLYEGYAFGVFPAPSDNGFDGIWKRIGNIGELLLQRPKTISAGTTYHVRADRVGDSLRFYLDGELYMSTSDSTYDGGLICFRFWDGGAIDNIVVRQIGSGSEDCNGNGTPDECDLADCDGSPWCSDCNENGVLDECDIVDGTSDDCQPNGVPDDCDIASPGARFNDSATWDTYAPYTFDLGICHGAGAVVANGYVYFMCDGSPPEVVRYQIDGDPLDPSSWIKYDAPVPRPAHGFAFDGHQYIYFTPSGSDNGIVMRYNTQGTFTDPSSWTTYDPGANGVGANLREFDGAVYDDIHGFVYFVPRSYGNVLRYDTSGEFTVASSWDAYDPPPSGGHFTGAVFAPPYIYFAPERDGTVLRYNTNEAFAGGSAWLTFDAVAAGIGNDPRGYQGGAFDGRYVYLAPYRHDEYGAPHGEVLRYDTSSGFSDASSWAAFDPGSEYYDAGGYDPDGFQETVFDGRFIYFVPYRREAEVRHSEVLRYDTAGAFDAIGSWSLFDPREHDIGDNPHGYIGGAFDGQYVYFSPHASNEVLRYDTTFDWSPDCNENGIPDECDISGGTSGDCNENEIPDECDIAEGTSEDCNSNGVPDECDIADGTSADCQPNGIPDECETIGSVIHWTVYPDPVIGPGVNGLASGGVTVLHDAGVYKAWNDNGPATLVAYTTSDDGIQWEPGVNVYDPVDTNDAGPEVVKKDGVYYLWVGETGGAHSVDFATSTDGITWTHEGWVPDWELYSLLPSSDGFEAWFTPFNDYSCYHYGTSVDGLAWEDHGCAMSSGAPGDFDEHMRALDVVNINGIYHMWYDAVLPSGTQFAYATSADGVNWDKHGPITGFEAFNASSPSVLLSGNNLMMWFVLNTANEVYFARTQLNDCNGNGVPDECDIADGTSEDLNENGIPDECENQPPVCDIVDLEPTECAGATTDVPLDGSGSSDPDDDTLSYWWESDCPGASFDDPTIAMPTLTVNTVAPCSLVCEVTLTVDDGALSDTYSANVTILDTTPPVVTVPEPLTIEVDGCNLWGVPSSDPTIAAWLDSASGADICGEVTLGNDAPETLPADCLLGAVTTITFTATDECGNSASGSSTVTIVRPAVAETDVKSQGFWKRVCAGPHPSGEFENLFSYLDFVTTFRTFWPVQNVEGVCDRLNNIYEVKKPTAEMKKCVQAEGQFMAMLMNLASCRAGLCNLVDDPDLGMLPAADVAEFIDDLLSDPNRTFEQCVLAQGIADRFNNGETLVETAPAASPEVKTPRAISGRE